jgi:O-antigen/teichoic acid export membrane protein
MSAVDKFVQILADNRAGKATGIYSISILFATLVTIPSRSLGKISGTLIADAWKENDLKQIANIYSKSCINQMIIGLYIFMMIVLNLEALYTFLPENYENGKYVIYFIGLASLFDMATGTNGIIISTSKYYRLQSLFVIVLFVLVVITNIIFIPRYGITGAAIASAISTFIYNLIRYLFLLIKFKLQPFKLKQVMVPLGGAVLFLIVNEFITFDSLYLHVAIPSCILTITYGLYILAFRFSEDIQEIVRNVLFRKSEK